MSSINRIAGGLNERKVKCIAIVAENASLGMGGEAAIPIRFFRGLRQHGMKVTLFTHARVISDLRFALTAEELANVEFTRDTWLQKSINAWANAYRRPCRSGSYSC